MKKNFKYAALAAFAFTLALSSCSNGDENSSDPAKGTPTTFTLALTFPKTYAVDDNASTAESMVKNIDVFILNTVDGSTVTYKRIPANQWTLSDGNKYTKAEIETTIGAKKIYVGINLPDAIRNMISANGLVGLNETKIHAITTAGLTDATNGFAMFSTLGVEKVLLKEADVVSSDATKDNKISVTVERMVAKVGVVKAATVTNVGDGTGTVDLSTLMYTLGNTNTKTFALQYKVSDVVIDPNYTGYPASYNDTDWEGLETTTANYVAVDANGTANSALAAKYGAENTADVALKGSNTYAAIKVQFLPAMYSNADGTDRDGTNGNTDDNFWTVTLGNGTRKFFDVEVDASMYTTAQTANAPTKEKYVYGICYYSMYLGKDNGYNFIRNNFYKATIKEIKGLGNYKPGIVDPSKPGDPVAKDAALIEMTVEVAPWNMINEDWVLEK